VPRIIAILVCALIAISCLSTSGLGSSQEEPAATILDMDSMQFTPGAFGGDKTPVGTVEQVEGKLGQALRFSFAADSRGGFFMASIRPTPEWDKAAGISFWVKGDGSDSWGGVEMIDASDFRFRYGYWFPIDSTEWTKITVPWCDLIPELPSGQFVDPERGYKPSHFGHLWFGKRIRWWEFPAHSFAVDQIQIERSIALDTSDYTPAVGGTPKTLAKLRAKQPVTIVTVGDSLSDKHHWANREVLWSEMLVKKLKEDFGGEVTLVNPAVGGNQLTHGLILMLRWLRTTPEPDLVTVWFGGNDWEDGMRGEHFREALRFAVDRIRRMTHGKSEIVLITTIPSRRTWGDMEEMAEAVRSVAQEKKTGLADVSAAFHEVGDQNETARDWLYAWDKVHLGPLGHPVTAETVYEAVSR